MSDGALIGFILFLAFGSAIAAFFSKMGQKVKLGLRLGPTMTVKDGSGRSFAISNAAATLNTAVVRRVMERLKRNPLPAHSLDLGGLKEKEKGLLDSVPSRSQALFAINTFRAHARGYFDYLTNDKDLLDRPGEATAPLEQFSDFVQEFIKTQVQEKIPNHAAQLDAFYAGFTPDEGEFIIAWADRIVLTSNRLVLLTEGGQPKIIADIPIVRVLSYEASDG